MRKQSKITLSDYLADKVPNECVEVLMNSGYQFEKPRSKGELSDLLSQYIARDKDKALKNLAEIHPDKDLCQSVDRPVMDRDFGQDFTQRTGMTEMYANPFWNPYANYRVRDPFMNANGCGCGGSTSFNGHLNCNGDTSCGCCASKKKSYNADGSSSTNNLLYLILGAGFVWFMINLDNKRQYK